MRFTIQNPALSSTPSAALIGHCSMLKTCHLLLNCPSIFWVPCVFLPTTCAVSVLFLAHCWKRESQPLLLRRGEILLGVDGLAKLNCVWGRRCVSALKQGLPIWQWEKDFLLWGQNWCEQPQALSLFLMLWRRLSMFRSKEIICSYHISWLCQKWNYRLIVNKAVFKKIVSCWLGNGWRWTHADSW